MSDTPTFTKRLPAAVVLAAAVALLALLVAAPLAGARSGFPGANGKLAFASDRDRQTGSFEIYSANPDGTGLSRVTFGTPGTCAQRPAWSPDGTKLAYNRLLNFCGSSRTAIAVINADSTGSAQLTDPPAGKSDENPAWSPDGTKIVFDSTRSGHQEVWVMNSDGSGLTQLTTTPQLDPTKSVKLQISQNPAWSPDGSKIIFDSNRDTAGQNEQLYTMNPDGSGISRLTTSTRDDTDPTWSADGKRIAFSSDRSGGQVEVWAMNADGSGATRLTYTANKYSSGVPAFSPDSKRIAFNGYPSGTQHVYVMNADGSGQVQVAPGSTLDQGKPIPSQDLTATWQTIPTDVTVAGTVSDGQRNPLAGVVVRVTGTTVGGESVDTRGISDSVGHYSVKLRKGNYTVAPVGTPAGQPAGGVYQPTICSGTAQPSACALALPGGGTAQADFVYLTDDPAAENLEVSQGVQEQTWDSGGGSFPVPGGGLAMSFSYSGVGLAAGGKTVARFYASNAIATSTTRPVKAQLRAFRDGAELSGGPLSPVEGDRVLPAGPVLPGARTGSAYTFVLPFEWAKGDVTLVASVDPAHEFPDCATCRQNDQVALTNIHFTDTKPLVIYPVQFAWTKFGRERTARDPFRPVRAVEHLIPLAQGQLKILPFVAKVDLTDSLRYFNVLFHSNPLSGVFGADDCNRENQCFGQLAETIIRELAVIREGRDLPGSGAGGSGLILGLIGPYSATGGFAGTSPGGNLAWSWTDSLVPLGSWFTTTPLHEGMHALGFVHSPGCGAAGAESWPSGSERASILGIGLDRRDRSGGTTGPFGLLDPGPVGEPPAVVDLMSYCEPRWISTINWNRLLARLSAGTIPTARATRSRSLGGRDASPTAAGRSPVASSATFKHGPAMTVAAVVHAGKATIAEVAPARAANRHPARSDYHIVVRDRRGQVVSDSPVAVQPVHGDPPPGSPPYVGGLILTAVNARAAVSVELAHNGSVVSRMRRTPGRLKLRILSPHRRARVHGRTLTVRFKTNLSPRSLRHVRIDYSADGGHHFRTVELGAHGNTATIPTRLLKHSRKPRLRVIVDDGFRLTARRIPLAPTR